jgi:subtilisin family serine protease
MKSTLPNNAVRRLLVLGSFLLATVLGWADSRVWVQFELGSKGPVLAALAQAGGRVHYEFDQLNAIAVTLPDQALAGLARNPNVVLIEEDPIRVMSGETVPYGIEMVQALNSTLISAGADGDGIIVGVIDSGVFAAHEDLPGAILRGEPTGLLTPGIATGSHMAPMSSERLQLFGAIPKG